MRMLAVTLAALLTLCQSITLQQHDDAMAICAELLTDDVDRIAGFVRLSFHDCVGKCDGCIDLNNPENNGLSVYITPLNDIYENTGFLKNVMSRADFWALCGAAAVARGHALAGRPEAAPVVTMRYGRVDCLTTPTDRIFPDGHGDLVHVLQIFSSTFNMTARETVALLGAHTLGRARPQNSGFDGPWVDRVTQLDNNYFVELIRPWIQIQNEEGKFQWRRPRPPNNLMLNADMCLDRNIQPDSAGANAQTDSRRIPRSSTSSIVAEYAASNGLWLREFGEVFTKMISNTNEMLEDPVEVSGETGISVTPGGAQTRLTAGTVFIGSSGSDSSVSSSSSHSPTTGNPPLEGISNRDSVIITPGSSDEMLTAHMTMLVMCSVLPSFLTTTVDAV